MHYISYYSYGNNFSLSKYAVAELPSIFFEVIAGYFLAENGYSMSSLYNILIIRSDDNASIAECLLPFFDSIIDYLENGKIGKEQALEKEKEELLILKKCFDENLEIRKYYQKMGYDFDKMTFSDILDKKYDDMAKEILKHGLMVFKSIQYVIGTYLKDEIIRKKNHNALLMMIMATNDLDSLNLKDILEIFSIKLPEESASKQKALPVDKC